MRLTKDDIFRGCEIEVGSDIDKLKPVCCNVIQLTKVREGVKELNKRLDKFGELGWCDIQEVFGEVLDG